MTLKVLTFNIFHDYPALRHFEERLAILERALVAEAADLVVLQEAWISRTHGDLVARLVEGLRQCGLAYQQFYAPANGSVGGGGEFEEGSAILSRWPIADAEARELAPEHPIERTWHGYVYQERRIAVRASVIIAGRCRLQVFGTHL
ncbi:MAG: hypothetical protein QOD06_687, partial [Candidatus Binatota bacterium]|nr:hypothetical protein [Candidatus Binatota bacterium]